jgi:hypothetical protein
MVYINMEFSHVHLVIFGGKPEYCEIPDGIRNLPNGRSVWKKKHFFRISCSISKKMVPISINLKKSIEFFTASTLLKVNLLTYLYYLFQFFFYQEHS